MRNLEPVDTSLVWSNPPPRPARTGTYVSPGRRLDELPMVPMPFGDDDAAHHAALQAVSAVDAGGDDRVRASAATMRATWMFTVSTIATVTWTLLLMYTLGASFYWLLAALTVSAAITMWYTVITQAVERRYTPAGVERAKIAAAERIHRDRLAARQAMHAAAVEAWTTVLVRHMENDHE